MQALSEHNKAAREAISAAKDSPHWAGVACDECGAEMLKDGLAINLSNPPTQWVRCPDCGFRGLMTMYQLEL